MPEQNGVQKIRHPRRTTPNPPYKPPTLPRKEELFPSDDSDKENVPPYVKKEDSKSDVEEKKGHDASRSN